MGSTPILASGCFWGASVGAAGCLTFSSHLRCFLTKYMISRWSCNRRLVHLILSCVARITAVQETLVLRLNQLLEVWRFSIIIDIILPLCYISRVPVHTAPCQLPCAPARLSALDNAPLPSPVLRRGRGGRQVDAGAEAAADLAGHGQGPRRRHVAHQEARFGGARHLQLQPGEAHSAPTSLRRTGCRCSSLGSGNVRCVLS